MGYLIVLLPGSKRTGVVAARPLDGPSSVLALKLLPMETPLMQAEMAINATGLEAMADAAMIGT